jgi:hypothetical protein
MQHSQTKQDVDFKEGSVPEKKAEVQAGQATPTAPETKTPQPQRTPAASDAKVEAPSRKPTHELAAYNFRTGFAERWAKGELRVTEKLTQANPVMGNSSLVLAEFEDGVVAKVAGIWWEIIQHKKEAKLVPPVFRPWGDKANHLVIECYRGFGQVLLMM